MIAMDTIERNGCIGRIELMDDPPEPDFDGTGHIFVVRPDRVVVKHADYGSSSEANALASAIDDAVNRWSCDWVLAERYLRSFHDVIGMDRGSWGSHNHTIVCVVTRRLAKKWGLVNLAPNDEISESNEVARTGLAPWLAWQNGDVYGYTIETESGDDIGSCWGYYGNDQFDYIKSCIIEEIDAYMDGVRSARVAMFRKLVNR